MQRLDDAENIKNLVDLGLLIPFDKNLELYWGGAAKTEEEAQNWSVKKWAKAGKNNSKNLDCGAALLPVSNIRSAAQLAEEMASSAGEVPVVKRIAKTSKEAYIINCNFNYKNLSSQELAKYNHALLMLASNSISSLAPLKFEYRKYGPAVCDELLKIKASDSKKYLTSGDIEELYQKFEHRYSKSLISHIAGTINAQIMCKKNPILVVQNFALLPNKDVISFSGAGSSDEILVCREAIISWCEKNHIIGLKTVANLGGNNSADAYFIFDLSKVATLDEATTKSEMLNKKYAEFALLASHFVEPWQTNKFELKLLKNGTPEEIIDHFSQDAEKELALMLDGTYQDQFISPIAPYFAEDAGVWEHFTIGEHTETVLRVFDRNFADEVPSEMHAFVRTALLLHDIGKGEAVKRGNKNLQQMYTSEIAPKFLKWLDATPNASEVIKFVIGDSQKYTSQYFVDRQDLALKKLYNASAEVLKKALERTPTDGEVEGLVEVCKIMQICDSGAYTRRAVTRDPKYGCFYNGSDIFTSSFEDATDLAGLELHDMRRP